MPVEEYRVAGVPPWLPDWQEFWRVAWSVLARGGSQHEARAVLYEVRDATPPKVPGWPWEDAELDRMVARAERRQHKVDADFLDEFGPAIRNAGRLFGQQVRR